MRTIIAGSRGLGYPDLVRALEACPWAGEISSVVSGRARGIDAAGEAWARLRGLPVDLHPALWEAEGRAAGYLRNARMSLVADALVAVWDGSSRGTQHMIGEARARGLRVFVHTCTPTSPASLKSCAGILQESY